MTIVVVSHLLRGRTNKETIEVKKEDNMESSSCGMFLSLFPIASKKDILQIAVS